MSENTENMVAVLDAAKAAEVAKVAKLAAKAHRELAAAEGDADKSLTRIAGRMFRVGSLVVESGESDRAFAILAEYGDRDLFVALRLAQPRRLKSYRLARVIYVACDAVGSDAAEGAAVYAMELREQGGTPTVEGFANYCAAGFELPAVKAPKAPRVPKELDERVTTFAKGLSADDLAHVAAMFADMAKAVRKAERDASKASKVA